MAPFPSPVERTVASALLLLCTTAPPSPQPPPPPPPPPRKRPRGLDGETARKECESNRSSIEEESLRLVSSATKSTSSSLTSDGSSKKFRSPNLRVVAVAARCREMKLKVVRRKRPEVSWSSGDRKAVPSLPMTVSSESTTTTEASCLSSNSSAASSARSRFTMISRGLERSEMKASGKPKRRQVGSGSGLGPTHLRSRAEGILKMLSGGCFSEVRIRQLLGDSPDTSKALRMLLKQEEIKRSGRGGRQDPYIYTISRENRELGQQY